MPSMCAPRFPRALQYFDGSLLVRKVSQHGTGHWGRLDAVLKAIQREAALAGAAAAGGAPPARSGSGKGRGGGAAQVLAVPVASPRRSAVGGAGPDVSGYVVSGQRPPRRQQGPPDSTDLSYFNGIELGGAKAGRGRGRGEREDFGGRFGGGGGREAGGRGRGGRGGGRREGRGGRGGRGGRERGGSYGGAAAEAAAAERAAVQKLFTGEVRGGRVGSCICEACEAASHGGRSWRGPEKAIGAGLARSMQAAPSGPPCLAHSPGRCAAVPLPPAPACAACRPTAAYAPPTPLLRWRWARSSPCGGI